MHVFGLWEDAGHLERTHAGTKRSCKLHTERPQLASKFISLAAMQQCYPLCFPVCCYKSSHRFLKKRKCNNHLITGMNICCSVLSVALTETISFDGLGMRRDVRTIPKFGFRPWVSKVGLHLTEVHSENSTKANRHISMYLTRRPDCCTDALNNTF